MAERSRFRPGIHQEPKIDMKKPATIIISLGTIAVLLFVLLVVQSNCVGNYYMTKIDPVYIIPNESSMCRFEVNQMNNGSGDWWIYAQDDSNYYFFLGYDSLPYIVFSRSTAEKCIGFDKVNVDTWCGIDTNEIVFQVEYRNLKAKDSTVVYAERLDNEHALLYRSNYPNTMFFVKLSDSSLYEIDSIMDFNHGFAIYRTEAELIEIMGDKPGIDINVRLRKWIDYGGKEKYHITQPIMNRFAGELFIVDDDGIYELSLSKRLFNKIVQYHMVLDIFETCSDSMIWRLPNPQKSISSSAIRVSFQDSSFFELTSNGTLNIQVVDSNSCLKVNGEYNQVHYDYAEGKKCNVGVPLCEPF